MAVALAALDAIVHVLGAGGERSIPIPGLHRLPGDEPAARHRARARRADHRGRAAAAAVAPRSRYRKVRDRASYAFARRLGRRRARACATARSSDGRIALGGVAHAPWRASEAEARLRGAAADRGGLRSARPRPSSRPPQPLRDNAFKVPLARNVIVADARRSCAREHHDDARSAPRSTRVDGRAKVTGAGALRVRAPVERRRLRRARCSARSPRGRDRRDRRRARRSRCPACSPCSRTTTRRALGETADGELLPAPGRRASPTAARSSRAVVAETLEVAREAAALVAHRLRRRAATTSSCAPTHPRLYTPDKVNPAFPTDTAQGDVDAGAGARARSSIDRTYTTPPSTTTRWSRTRRVARVGRPAA